MSELPPTLLLDMDGPMADFDKHHWDLCVSAGLEFDIDSVEQQTHRYLSDHIVGRKARREAYKICCAAGFFRELPVVEGLLGGLEQIERIGVDVWICAKPMADNPHCRDEKAAWVREHVPHLLDKLIIAPDKSKIRGDALLDDAINVQWPDRAVWRPIIFDAPYNRDGSEWERWNRWRWGDPIEDLEELIGFH